MSDDCEDDCGSKSRKTAVTDGDGIQKPVCLTCQKVISNNSIKQTNLKRRIHKMHGSKADKGIEYYKSLISVALMENTEKNKFKETSYRLSYRIAKAGKFYTSWS
jgi:hypothetical protein